MISPEFLYHSLADLGVNYYTGVPDSLLKSFCAYVTEHARSSNHVISVNEGAAVGLAIGYSLATGNIPLVYMQNSGLGNAFNPLISLVDPQVYSIPMLLMIGWRGEPQKQDEPQHIKQGTVMLDVLEAIDIPYRILSGDEHDDAKTLKWAVHQAKEKGCAVALIVRNSTFEKVNLSVTKGKGSKLSLTREGVIRSIIDELVDTDIVVATTGMTSRELFEYRQEKKQGHYRDFLTVGGMGHAASIAVGISLQNVTKRVICIDGDGAALMHMGAMAMIGAHAQQNFKHILINNGAHDSVGGQPTVGFAVDFDQIAQGCCYKYTQSVNTSEQLSKVLPVFLHSAGPSFLEIKVTTGCRDNLARPSTSLRQNKADLMSFLQS